MSTPAARPVDPDSPPHRGPGRTAGHPGPHSSEEPGAKAQHRARPVMFLHKSKRCRANCWATACDLERTVSLHCARFEGGHGHWGIQRICSEGASQHLRRAFPLICQSWQPLGNCRSGRLVSNRLKHPRI
jgi:hypothetical protein